MTTLCAHRPTGRAPSAKPTPATARRSPSSVLMTPWSLFWLNQIISPRISRVLSPGAKCASLVATRIDARLAGQSDLRRLGAFLPLLGLVLDLHTLGERLVALARDRA